MPVQPIVEFAFKPISDVFRQPDAAQRQHPGIRETRQRHARAVWVLTLTVKPNNGAGKNKLTIMVVGTTSEDES